MFRFEGLEIWHLAIDYGKDRYQFAGRFPKYEIYALSDQLRRSGISISNNIAEGSVGSSASFQKYITISVGSALETVNIFSFAFEMGYIDSEEKAIMYEKAEKLIRKLRSFSKAISDKR